MDRNVLVLTINDHPVVQNSAKIMLKSLLLRKIERGSIVVLYPEGAIPYQTLPFLRTNRIVFFSYQLATKNDFYTIKFLVLEFMREYKNCIDSILYLDADHIVLSGFNIPSISLENCFYVSSQVQLMPPDIRKNLSKTVPYYHYNNSLIYGNAMQWQKIINTWKVFYFNNINFISMRYCEEISFSDASFSEEISLIPVNEIIQSNFYSFNCECSLFHYGGEFEQTKKIKACLTDESLMYSNLKALLNGSTDYLERWLSRKILTIINDYNFSIYGGKEGSLWK